MIAFRRFRPFAALVALSVFALGGHARAEEGEAVTGGTVAAVPSDSTPAAMRPVSASVFRPAPMPSEEQNGWSATGETASDEATLHPEILSMPQVGGSTGALTTASSDYDHDARMRPAGGMGLTIPVQ